jgi:hypothetical protein
MLTRMHGLLGSMLMCSMQPDAESHACLTTRGVFTSHANPKYFLFHLLYQIFERMYGVLNIGKKDN